MGPTHRAIGSLVCQELMLRTRDDLDGAIAIHNELEGLARELRTPGELSISRHESGFEASSEAVRGDLSAEPRPHLGKQPMEWLAPIRHPGADQDREMRLNLEY